MLCPQAAYAKSFHPAVVFPFGKKALFADSRSSWSARRWEHSPLSIHTEQLTEGQCSTTPTPRNQRSCRGSGVAATDERQAATDSREHDYLEVRGVKYLPPGTTEVLLNNVNLSLPRKSLGLIYGRSGSGKTTLLQLLAGLVTPTEGSITVGAETFGPTRNYAKGQSLASKAGIVFQFPERYFIADTILEELVFGWPRRTQDEELRRMLSFRLQTAIYAVGLQGVPLDTSPRALSDGFKRRLALAVQLVRMPDLLLLDEPLAGLDWMARAEVVKLLSSLKQSQTLVVVSHDLKELTPLVDRAWQMEMGGVLSEQPWPPQ